MPKPGTASIRVLLAECSVVGRSIATWMLDALGCEVEVFGNGRDAVRALKNSEYDVLLIDLNVTGVTVYEIARLAKSKAGEIRPWVIAMTRPRQMPDDSLGGSLIDDQIRLPVNLDDLRAALGRWKRTATGILNHAHDDSESPIDRHVIERLRVMQVEGEPDIIEELSELYFNDTPKRIDMIRHAIESADVCQLEVAAHCLKGSSANLGVRNVQRLCTQLQNIARSGDLTHANDVVQHLEIEFEHARRAFKTLK